MKPARADLPDWPALMRPELAAAYLDVSETQFNALALRHGLRAVDLGTASVRYRRREIDAVVDSLGHRGLDGDPAAPSPLSPAEAALARAGARAAHS